MVNESWAAPGGGRSKGGLVEQASAHRQSVATEGERRSTGFGPVGLGGYGLSSRGMGFPFGAERLPGGRLVQFRDRRSPQRVVARVLAGIPLIRYALRLWNFQGVLLRR